ncbi:MAG: class I SAM-dependent methyltransferase [Candidatus Niyogibacteria bacterium]|nr:class I SAM-dependent methyltransferase [Candidatus Niyogibacteria bacterium]
MKNSLSDYFLDLSINMAQWDDFFKQKITKIFTEKKSVVDIGGGLRISKEKGNRYDASRKWILDLARARGVDYKILDPSDAYHPDIVGDIHNLPFGDDSQDAIICVAVLEHVEDPMRAVREIRRVLKPGGHCLCYVPFLYYFHAEKGYYHDYWRFTKEAVDLLFKDFSSVEKQSVRGAIGTWIHLSPLGRSKFFVKMAEWMDVLLKKSDSAQVSGYSVFAIK